MTEIARVFMTGRSQAVRLPKAYRFDSDQVFIRRDPGTGDVILSARPTNWDGLFALDAEGSVPADFMDESDRADPSAPRDPFAGA